MVQDDKRRAITLYMDVATTTRGDRGIGATQRAREGETDD
jgi:hypothetical protein